MRILAISGSLRAGSSNTAVLQAAAALAPPGVDVILFSGLGDLPHFNPDLDTDDAPPAVAEYRAQLRAADAVLICSPEYAHGTPGVMKNALDWVVGSGELMEKPVGLINASPRSLFAHASLTEVLTTMSARMVPEASVALETMRRGYDAEAIANDAALAATIRGAIEALVRAAAA